MIPHGGPTEVYVEICVGVFHAHNAVFLYLKAGKSFVLQQFRAVICSVMSTPGTVALRYRTYRTYFAMIQGRISIPEAKWGLDQKNYRTLGPRHSLLLTESLRFHFRNKVQFGCGSSDR